MERGYLVKRLADLVDEHRETPVTIETVDNEKAQSASRGYDVPHMSEVLRHYEGCADKVCGSAMDVGTRKMAYTLKQRIGRDRTLSCISSARSSGAAAIHPVTTLPERGFFAPPTILADTPTTSAAFRDKTFGPCTAAAQFRGKDEALAVANGTRYRLVDTVFTRDRARAHRATRELEADTTWVNSSNDSDVQVPFGGVKESGLRGY
ncbi:aldehyde dehydrogenase-like protein [Tolypocladium capitatum]|uniref:aldehyde dehydrogenase (NAD(+)) n=1 Tax=Tolypocladium capitatum TaxID=45235 RepID=A0A2K3Q6R2_9HYPO|nr:aldehyde dehydrogenase-like protein [Tolypocladium capitatum]